MRVGASFYISLLREVQKANIRNTRKFGMTDQIFKYLLHWPH